MNHDYSQRLRASVWLPVTPATHLNARSNLHQPFFGSGQVNSAGQQKRGKRLYVSAAKPPTRPKPSATCPIQNWPQPFRFSDLRTPHKSILMVMRVHMPIFEYICKECHHQFEALVYGKQKAECPKCHTKKLEPQLSVFAVSAKGASASPSSSGACGSCGDPRGPGSCSMRDMN